MLSEQKTLQVQTSTDQKRAKRGLWDRVMGCAPHIERLGKEKIDRLYPLYRWSVLESTFLGYAMFYLVRNNLSTVAKDIEGSLHYTHTMVGSILAITALTYGAGKLIMGSVSDRSNPRKFMAMGLLLTAVCNFAFGAIANFHMHMFLWALNGFIQGMGWAPCGRSMGHWFSVRERGVTFSIWNTSHNLGGGIAGVLAAWAASNYGWQYAFYFPGVIAVIGAVYVFFRLSDTPQSVGLPSVEEYHDDYTQEERSHGTHERELSTKELFVDNVLKNKYVWLLAFANFFAYIARYSMLDWGPVYLREAKNATLYGGGMAIMLIEFGGIPSTILIGWLSDKVGGRRAMVAFLCMIPILLAFTGIILNPAGHLWIDMCLLMIVGAFIYPVINFFVIMALDFTSKKAIGTAAGFIGLFGYIGRAVQAQSFGWIADHFGKAYSQVVAWNIILTIIIASTVIGMILLGTMWNVKPKA